MTKEEAIAYWKPRYEHIIEFLEKTKDEPSIREYAEAIDMAIEALLADNIDVNDVTIHYKPYPSAESEKIVYCKDCINRWDIIRCPIDDTYTVNDNDYCSFGIKKNKLDIDYDAIRI